MRARQRNPGKRSRWLALLLLLALQVIEAAGAVAGPDALEAKAVAFARAKYDRLSLGDPNDPMTPAAADLCRSVAKVPLGPFCGLADVDVGAYLVEVLPRNHGTIRDVIGVTRCGDTFSLLDDAGIQQLVSESNGKCETGKDLMSLALLHLRLIFSPADPNWKPERLCAILDDPDQGVCVAPAVRRRLGQLSLEVRVLGARYQALPEWEEWRFMLKNGRYSSVLEK